MELRELMSSPVLTAVADETLEEASARMHEHRVGSVVVVEGEKCMGILTERDLLRAYAHGALPSARVGAWMTSDPLTLEPESTVNEASEMMSTHDFRHVPVVEDGRLLGLVSLRDVMKVSILALEKAETAAAPGPYDAPSGLENVAVSRTEVGDVQGQQGFYHYRGYNAVDLAVRGTVEDVWHLMHEGELPRAAERDAFAARARKARVLPDGLGELLSGIARLGAPGSLYALRTAISAAGQVIGCESWIDQPLETTRDQAFRFAAMTPVMAAALYRLRSGEEVVDPHPDLDYAANYLYMVTGSKPDPDQVMAVERYLILTIDHGFNNSTFAARVITSSGADLGAAMAGGAAALSGPLHGGAPARVMQMLEQIGTPENAEPWIRDALSRKVRLMGFGHRVYRTTDPRSEVLHDVARRFGGESLAFAEHVEEVATRLLNEKTPGRGLYANVEFYAGVVLEQAGLPRDMFSPTFTCSRVIGWAANILEQVADNRIFRPLAHYTGSPPPRPLPEWWRRP